jgi:hypothetical protein
VAIAPTCFTYCGEWGARTPGAHRSLILTVVGDERGTQLRRSGGLVTQPDTPETAATTAASDEEEQPARPVRLHQRLIRRFEGQIQLPGGLVVNGVGKLGVVFVALFAVVAITVVVTRWEPKAKVPALIGATRQEAEARLGEAHLVVGGIQHEESTQPVDTVLRTDPMIGTSLARDSGVLLVLAGPLGGNAGLPQTVPIPPSAGTGDPSDSRAGGPGPGNTSGGSKGGATSSGGKTTGEMTSKGDGPSNPSPSTDDPAPDTSAEVSLSAGSAEPDPNLDSCDTGYQMNFTQPVSMSEPGEVTYRWIGSDGGQTAVETLVFDEAGARTAETTWLRTGAPGETLEGWQRLEVLSPTSVHGNKLGFEHTCPDSLD